MVLQSPSFHSGLYDILTNVVKPLGFDQVSRLRGDFVFVTMSFYDRVATIVQRSQFGLFWVSNILRGVNTQSKLGQHWNIDDRSGIFITSSVAFHWSSTIDSQEVSHEFKHSDLKCKTSSQEWIVVYSSILGDRNYTFDTTVSKSTKIQNIVGLKSISPLFVVLRQVGIFGLIFQVYGLNPFDIQ